MNKTLILINDNKNRYFINKNSHYNFKEIYRSNMYVSRILRKIAFKLCLPGRKFFLGKWKYDFDSYDTIILFDTGNAKELLDYIFNYSEGKRIIFWYWNAVAGSISPKLIDKKYEIWSFDKEDCKTYNFKYNTQFYVKENISHMCKEIYPIYDFIFVGQEKGRTQQLSMLADELDNLNLLYEFYIVDGKAKKINSTSRFKYGKMLLYPEIIKRINTTRGIIDIVFEKQSGMTLRPLEALFFKKKLVTNYANIVKEKFYNKNNIFIIGQDDIKKLRDFIYSPYDTTNYDEYICYYSTEKWLERFDDINY